MKKMIFVAVLSAVSVASFAADVQVFNWKTDKGSNAYSDTPNNMQMGRSNVINVRTGSVTPPEPAKPAAPTNVVEAQAALNEQIIAENQRREEAAAKLAAETKADNCKTAQMNLDMVNKTNARNKADLIPKYNADIAKFCN
ncbi:MAG: DUF4124 domain-containing protein [Alysiella sp.]|uniref:DUF4124 domain-containing protein n=1 Tax=Alysiella sp. TaxID=1872483 RepID=UPI0026DD27B7|nr:DUF4124 domain-containing protein [Alysiella sp.]MDO4434074.1 DUF4124 domain-containing protein [Alysiella sp.]